MKLGIVGTGNVGCAIALAAVARGSAREVVVVNRTSKVAEAVATDLRYGTPLGVRVDISHGDYDALQGAGVVLVTSGVNEKTGGATDRSDPLGRLRLLEKNAAIYRETVPQIVKAAPRAVLVAMTDPPDPLADIARIAEMVLRDERSAIPIGSYQPRFGVTLSLPCHERQAKDNNSNFAQTAEASNAYL
jgi:L-lactate dehydrogenase